MKSSMDVVYGHVNHLPPTTLKQVRWKSMSGLELSGYLHVKVPTKDRKFNSWKAWKRQWCLIRRNGNTVNIQTGSEKTNLSSIVIPEDVIICRTESRSKYYAFGIFQANKKRKQAYLYLSGDSETESQKWISNIRCLLKPPVYSPTKDEFDVSLIDNNHSREAGLAGLYGYLSVTPAEIIVKDAQTSKIKITWHWSQISHSYLPLPANSEDVHRICVIRTSSKFKAGEGELEVFCLQADQLHSKLSSCSHFANVPRILTQPLPMTPDSSPPITSPSDAIKKSPSSESLDDIAEPPPAALLSSRRMSRSETDLRKFFVQDPVAHFRQNSSREIFLLSHENLASHMKKSPSFIFANVGFLISTPGCSEAGSLSDVRSVSSMRTLDDKIEYEMINEEEADHVNRVHLQPFEKHRRQTHKQDSRASSISGGASSTSGDYEEISLKDGEFDEEYRSLVDTPPPLPPRSSQNSPSSDKKSEDEKKKLFRSNTAIEYSPTMLTKRHEKKYASIASIKEKILISEPFPI